MTDIVLTLKDHYAAKDIDAWMSCLDAAEEIEKLRALLELYRDAVRIDAKMEGPVFAGMNRSALKRAWDADLAAMEGE